MIKGKFNDYSNIKSYSSTFKSLIKKLLTSNSDDRPSIAEVFSNIWFKQYTAELDINMEKYRTQKAEDNTVSDTSSFTHSYTTYSRISVDSSTPIGDGVYKDSFGNNMGNGYNQSKINRS